MVVHEIKRRDERRLWELYLLEMQRVEKPITYAEYKKKIEREYKKRQGTKPDKKTFYKQYGNKIKRPEGRGEEKCL